MKFAAIFAALMLLSVPAFAQTGACSNIPGKGYVCPQPHTFSALMTLNGGVALVQSTVAQLPTCNAARKGQMRAVTDATAPAYNGALTGGGAVSVPVWCSGAAWLSH
jgi:hypothetical protein